AGPGTSRTASWGVPRAVVRRATAAEVREPGPGTARLAPPGRWRGQPQVQRPGPHRPRGTAGPPGRGRLARPRRQRTVTPPGRTGGRTAGRGGRPRGGGHGSRATASGRVRAVRPRPGTGSPVVTVGGGGHLLSSRGGTTQSHQGGSSVEHASQAPTASVTSRRPAGARRLNCRDRPADRSARRSGPVTVVHRPRGRGRPDAAGRPVE